MMLLPGPYTGPAPAGIPGWRRLLSSVAAAAALLVPPLLGLAACGSDGTGPAPGGLPTLDWINGTSWTTVWTGTDGSFTGVWGGAATDIVPVANHARENDSTLPTHPAIVRFDGSSWSEVFVSRMAHDLNAVWGAAGDDVFAVGQNGLILHREGLAWAEMDRGTGRDLLGVRARSATEVYAVGEAGTILGYDGSAWQPVSTPTFTGSTLRGSGWKATLMWWWSGMQE